MTRTKEELEKIYDTLNESEKFGLQFSLFPYRIHSELKLNTDDCVALMRIRMEREKHAVNKITR